MIWQAMKLLGIESFSTAQTMWLFAALIVLVLVLGYVADCISSDIGLGILPNATVMLAAVGGALVAYARLVQPVGSASPQDLLMLTVGAASLALLSTVALFTRAYRM